MAPTFRRVAFVGAGLGVAAAIAARLAGSRTAGSRATGSEKTDAPRSLTAGIDGASSQLGRGASLLKVGGGSAVRYAKMSAATIGANEDDKAAAKAAFEIETAEQAVAALGNMKGALMKLGQMASYLDQGLPEPVRESLAQLQSDAPPMSYELVEQVIKEDLGAPPEELFESFDRGPIAAASIGQVHKAVTKDGEAVAVKVQYPGVADAINADLANSDMLFAILGALFPGLDNQSLVEEISERLLEELDYELEATNQQVFVDFYEGHPTISVPKVFSKLSSRRVLTTEFVEGAKWSDLLTWSREERGLAAETIYRFVFGGLYQLAMFNGDPHPGNYLFQKGGKVTFLDFGLCKRFDDQEVEIMAKMLQAMVIEDDIPKFRSALIESGVLTADSQISEQQIREYFSHFYESVLEDKVLLFTPEYAAESVRRYFDLSNPHIEVMKSANLPPSMVLIQRINLGLYALLAELEAEANWRAIANEIWPFVKAAPSTPMGEAIKAWEKSRGLLDD